MHAVSQRVEKAFALREAIGSTPENFAMWQVGDEETRLADGLPTRYASTVARIFNEETGYDFRRRADRKKFMDELIKDKPHEVYFRLHLPAWETAIPKDRELRSLNFVARRSEETVAKFCSEAYAVQQQEGRGAHLEVNSTSAI